MPTKPISPALCFRSAIRSDVGLVRENNEDAVYARPDFLVLADGMGGHSSGEIASAVAVHTFAAASPAGEADSFRRAADQTRQILQAMSGADETLETMGTTIIALGARAGKFTACHIGDSRLYLLRAGELSQITTDHTHVQRLVELGKITREQISTHPYRAMLLKSLDDQPGGADPDQIDLGLTEGDRVLLCSDGLSDYVSQWAITDLLRRGNPDQAADALIDAALRAGTRDNITVIVADVEPQAKQTQPQVATFGGAAAEPIEVSAPAAAALRKVAPEFTGPLVTAGEQAEQQLTQTQLLPTTHVSATAQVSADAQVSAATQEPREITTEAALRAGPLMFAIGAVGVVIAAVALLL